MSLFQSRVADNLGNSRVHRPQVDTNGADIFGLQSNLIPVILLPRYKKRYLPFDCTPIARLLYDPCN